MRARAAWAALVVKLLYPVAAISHHPSGERPDTCTRQDHEVRIDVKHDLIAGFGNEPLRPMQFNYIVVSVRL
jgi:hypothetical protein